MLSFLANHIKDARAAENLTIATMTLHETNHPWRGRFAKTLIAVGGSAKVYRAKRNEDDVILKITKNARIFLDEYCTLRKLEGGAHLPPLVEAFYGRDVFTLVFAHLPGFIDCFTYLDSRDPLTEDETRFVMGQIRDAFYFMISRAGIYHSDLVAENVLIHPEIKRIRLIDFGNVCPYSTSKIVIDPERNQRIMDEKTVYRYIDQLGILHTRTPELISEGRTFDDAHISFSFGTLATFLHLGDRPFETYQDRQRYQLCCEFNARSAFHLFLQGTIKKDPMMRTDWRFWVNDPYYHPQPPIEIGGDVSD